MAKRKRGVRWWLVGERIFQRLFHVQTLGSADDLLLVRVKTYHGEVIRLEDGTELNRGDEVLEVHLNNQRLLHLHTEAHTDMRLAKSLLREIRDTLVQAARYLDHPDRQSVKALYGITMIHRGVQALGFTTIPLRRGLFFYLTTWYLRLLMVFLHPRGRTRLGERTDQLIPKQLVMSRAELFARYAKKD